MMLLSFFFIQTISVFYPFLEYQCAWLYYEILDQLKIEFIWKNWQLKHEIVLQPLSLYFSSFLQMLANEMILWSIKSHLDT